MIDSLAATPDAQSLKIFWTEGRETVLSAHLLRREAKDAWTIREKIDFGEVAVADGISITALHQVGAAGVNVHFSDGHDKAIYPFVYLRELSDRFDN